jgi:hypothetical protein
MNDNNKMLERVLLMMKYNPSKTLTENSDVVRNEFAQLLNERYTKPRPAAVYTKPPKNPGKIQASGLSNAQIHTQVNTYATTPLTNGTYPSVKQQVDYGKALKTSSAAKPASAPALAPSPAPKPATATGTVTATAPAGYTLTAKPVKSTKRKPKVTSKDVGILSKIKTKITDNPWKFAMGLGLTGGAIWYFLRDKTNVAPCLLNSLSEEEMAGLAGTTGTITRAQVGNRLADLNGGLIYSLDNTGVTTGNGKYKGTYSCEGDAIKISIAGSEFTIGSTGTDDKGVNTDNVKKRSGYKQCPETFPIAMYCKNSTIARVQGCVGAKQDGAFGPNTSAALVAKGADGSSITQATIDKVCGGGQSNKQSAPGSDAEEDDAGGGNTMTVKSSGPLATDDADEA